MGHFEAVRRPGEESPPGAPRIRRAPGQNLGARARATGAPESPADRRGTDAARLAADLQRVTAQVNSALASPLQINRSTGPDDTVRRAPGKNKKKPKTKQPNTSQPKTKQPARATATQRASDAVDEPEPEAPVEPVDPVELAEQEQQAEGSPWQQKIHAMSRPEIEPHAWSGPARENDPERRALPARFQRRRERALESFVANHPARIVENERREQRKIDDAPYEEKDAKAALDAKHTAVVASVKAGRKKIADHVDLSTVDELQARARTAKRDESWYELDNVLHALDDEVRRLVAYVETIDSARARIAKLPQSIKNKKFDLMSKLQELRNELRKSATDAAFSAKLQYVVDAIQVEEDTVEQAGERATLRSEGRWPGNNNENAVIETVTRSTVGTDPDERAAVVEALDALKDSTKPHGWARKWGVYHGNGEGNLPGVPGAGGYTEYYVRPPGSAVGDQALQPPGARRLVRHTASGRIYYSDNHYGSPDGTNLPAFVLVTDA